MNPKNFGVVAGLIMFPVACVVAWYAPSLGRWDAVVVPVGLIVMIAVAFRLPVTPRERLIVITGMLLPILGGEVISFSTTGIVDKAGVLMIFGGFVVELAGMIFLAWTLAILGRLILRQLRD